jgi:spermidine dehydrogenase
MNQRDRRLGMNADISRRDFLNGVSVAIGASLLPTSSNAQDIGAQGLADYYPPQLSGMRGSHPGSFEAAHMARDGATWDGDDTGEQYDLVVVGGGISGLSAAYFYRQAAGKDARILVLDNHDDFGGHAKRNEFTIDGRLMIGYGGTQSLESPGGYPDVAKQLLRELGIDTERFYEAFDRKLYSSLGLRRGTFFNKATFGTDHLAIGNLSDPKVLGKLPISDRGKGDLKRLLADEDEYLKDMPVADRRAYLGSIDYRTYLKKHAGIDDEVLNIVQARGRGLWAIGIDALPARVAWSSGFPGFADIDLGGTTYRRDRDEPYIFHFPDGNASVARLLVRKMIPAVAPGNSMEDIVTARFDYRQLDNPDSAVRIRLNSTAVRARHIDDNLKNPVTVTYLRDGEARSVTAGHVVMACYHAMIPRLCPEMPQDQRTAMSNALRAPLVYTNVLIRNWLSFVKLGIQRASCPGCYHSSVSLDFPVSLGDYQCPKDPNEPMVLHLTRVPIFPGLSAREQFAASKRELLATSFETFERNIRDQLGRLLSDGGFDPARDIAGITVNRWPHGYAYGYDPETDQVAFEPSQWPVEKRHWRKASKRFGNISVAATDAASNAMTESAIEEAHRAVSDLG